MAEYRTIHSPATLTVSCVIYNTEAELFLSTVQSLAKSCAHAKRKLILNTVEVSLIDNEPNHRNRDLLQRAFENYGHYFDSFRIIGGHGNGGYGQGNNLSLLNAKSDYHLVLNPDVILAQDNIVTAITFLSQHPEVGLLAPDAKNQLGEREYIAKRYPSTTALLARALKIKWLTGLLEAQLVCYEYRDKIPAKAPLEIVLASGCYMLLRTAVAQSVLGFNEKYFMYFEDFDLSLKIGKTHKVVHHPFVRVVHYGGNTAKKGLRHIYYFVRSLLKFKVDTFRQ